MYDEYSTEMCAVYDVWWVLNCNVCCLRCIVSTQLKCVLFTMYDEYSTVMCAVYDVWWVLNWNVCCLRCIVSTQLYRYCAVVDSARSLVCAGNLMLAILVLFSIWLPRLKPVLKVCYSNIMLYLHVVLASFLLTACNYCKRIPICFTWPRVVLTDEWWRV